MGRVGTWGEGDVDWGGRVLVSHIAVVLKAIDPRLRGSKYGML